MHRANQLRLAMLALSLISLVAAAPARAKTTLFVDVGWGNHYRSGHWSPIYVTLSDSSPREVVVNVNAPTGRRYAIDISQSLAIGPTDVTIPIYVPLWYQLDQATVTVRDANSLRTLASTTLSNFDAGQANAPNLPIGVPGDALFIGVSGNGQTQRLLAGQIESNQVRAAFLPQERLPAVPIGYDAIDLLILNCPELDKLSLEQQSAIANWVRAGGLLVLWPGAGPIPKSGPLIDILPCTIGQNIAVSVDPTILRAAGLPTRFADLRGRELSEAAADARIINLPLGSRLIGYRHWVGYGQVAVLPVDVSMFTFNSSDHAERFWKQLLRGIADFPHTDPNQTIGGVSTSDSRHQIAMRAALDWIGNIPGAGEFGFSYLAGVMLAMMVIVGPVDWFVLKWLGRQPWTWVTILGWIGVVTFGGIYAGHLIRSGDLVFRTARIIDETDGARVASRDLVGIYSPQTRRYELSVDPRTWWSPAASDGISYGPSGLQLDIPCHQDYRGNRPEDLLINIWNLRLLDSRSYEPASAVVQADLSRAGDEIRGTITNRGTVPLDHLAIRTHDGAAELKQSIPAGKSVAVSAVIKIGDNKLSASASGPDSPSQWTWYQQQHSESNGHRPHFPMLNALADRRAVRIDQMLADGAEVAVIYAEFDGASDAQIKLNQSPGEKPASESHIGAVRAVVRLKAPLK